MVFCVLIVSSGCGGQGWQADGGDLTISSVPDAGRLSGLTYTTHTCLVAARGTVDTSLTVHWQRSQAQSAREPTNWPSVPAIQSAGRCEQGMCTRRGRRRRCGGSRNSLATGLIHAAARVRSSTLAYARITPAPLARVQSELADRSLFCMITSKLPFAASTPPREA
jgi:hypothetical protein